MDLIEEISHPLDEVRAELAELQREIKAYLKNDKRTVMLIDPEGLKPPWNEYYITYPYKKEKFIGCYSPKYSRMFYMFYRKRSKGSHREYQLI